MSKKQVQAALKFSSRQVEEIFGDLPLKDFATRMESLSFRDMAAIARSAIKEGAKASGKALDDDQVQEIIDNTPGLMIEAVNVFTEGINSLIGGNVQQAGEVK